MEVLIKLDRWLVRILEYILIGLFAVFLSLVIVLVFLRYGFSSSILGGNEFVTIAFIYTSAIGGAVAISRREHIAITYFIDLLPRKIKMMFYVIGLALIGLINLAMIYYSYSWISQAGHMPWQPLGWNQGYVQSIIPIGCGLAVLFCINKIILALAGHEQIDVLWMPED